MKREPDSFARQLARAATRKAFAIITVASLVTAGMGFWTHRAYAAKAKAEMRANQQATTLNDVMAKLNAIESEMLQKTEALNAKLESVEYQNAKLAAYEVRAHSGDARFELAATHSPVGPALPGVYPQLTSTVTTPLELETEVCHKTSLSGAAKFSIEPDLKAFGRVNVGLDEFGDGVEADARVDIDAKLGFDLGGDTGFEKNTCLKIAKFNVFGEHPPTVDVAGFINSVTTSTQTLAEKLVQIHSSLPQISTSAITTGLDNLANVNLNLSPQTALQMLDSPKTAFQTASANISNVISSLPLPGNVGSILQDPSSLISLNLDPSTFCSNFSGTGGLISNLCAKVPATLADLQSVENTVNSLTNVQTDLTNVKASLSGFCGSINTGLIGPIDNASIQIPVLSSFSYIAGVDFSNFPFSVPNLIYATASIGPETITNPIHVSPIACP